MPVRAIRSIFWISSNLGRVRPHCRGKKFKPQLFPFYFNAIKQKCLSTMPLCKLFDSQSSIDVMFVYLGQHFFGKHASFLHRNKFDVNFYYIFFYYSEGLSGVSHYFWAEFPVSLSNHVGTTPRLLICPLGTVTPQWQRPKGIYSGTHHSPEGVTHLKTDWAQDVWLQWSYENWYFYLDISCWLGYAPTITM